MKAERNIWKRLSIVLFFGMVVTMLIFTFAMKDGTACISNPLVYGAEKLSIEENGGLVCSCSFNKGDYAPFRFDEDKVHMSKKIPTDYSSPNFTLTLNKG